ncbi:hypothetical protein [Corynebacterium accolens]|uniref:hypothetical protein n=1 Tax=Corynebacterium accolens TaxID=38284 RepID=UPI00254D3356|nr:hypothetical protein [Corynebacterium accolens]MDK8593435.1 hypothetical protein [Corynebacterium accolens]
MARITPEEARRIEALNAEEISIDRVAITTCDLAGQIVDMHHEYAVQTRHNGSWQQVTDWSTDPNLNMPGHTPTKDERIVRRLVSQPEVMEP